VGTRSTYQTWCHWTAKPRVAVRLAALHSLVLLSLNPVYFLPLRTLAPYASALSTHGSHRSEQQAFIFLLSRFPALHRLGRGTFLHRRFPLIALPLANANAKNANSNANANARALGIGLFVTVLHLIVLCRLSQGKGRDNEKRGKERQSQGDDEVMHEALHS
jgi:hypothetical protein